MGVIWHSTGRCGEGAGPGAAGIPPPGLSLENWLRGQGLPLMRTQMLMSVSLRSSLRTLLGRGALRVTTDAPTQL